MAELLPRYKVVLLHALDLTSWAQRRNPCAPASFAARQGVLPPFSGPAV